MTYTVAGSLLLVAAAGVAALIITRRRRRMPWPRPIRSLGRGPVRAELPIAASGRVDRGEECGGDARRMFGYASWDGGSGKAALVFRAQAEQITSECDRLGIALLEIVREREPQRGRALDRPGLGYALENISAGKAGGLIVGDLCRIAGSAAELGRVLQWFLDHDARLIAIRPRLDTRHDSGRLAVRTIIEVARWERERLVERTRNGMLAARRKGPPGVADYPHLKARIAQMRAAGMTLEAIAGQLNREGTPTVRGGAKWRPSSVQVAAGYRRPAAGYRNHSRRNAARPKSSAGNA